jgi:hypothetical protein
MFAITSNEQFDNWGLLEVAPSGAQWSALPRSQGHTSTA